MGIRFQSPYHPIPTENLWESPQNPHTHRTTKSSIPIPQTLCLFTNKLAVHVTVLVTVFSNDNGKNSSKTKYKRELKIQKFRNANSDYDIYRVFNAFPLNITSIRKDSIESPQSPYPSHIPIPMGIPIPRAALTTT